MPVWFWSRYCDSENASLDLESSNLVSLNLWLCLVELWLSWGFDNSERFVTKYFNLQGVP